MKNIQLGFLHGLEGSPNGFKAQRLKKHDPQCWCPELTSDVTERLALLCATIKTPRLLIGSSLGGLTALAFAMKYPELVSGLVLLAPAVGVFRESGISGADQTFLDTTIIPVNIPTVVIAAYQDDVIPMDAIEKLIERSLPHNQLKLSKVNDDHALNNHHDLMIESIEWVKRLTLNH